MQALSHSSDGRTAGGSSNQANSGSFDHYQGGRGYQPMIALWAEADLGVADQFRGGNVPAHQEPLSCCQMRSRHYRRA